MDDLSPLPRGPSATTARLDGLVERAVDDREQLQEHTKTLADHTSTLRVLKVLGSIGIVVVGIVGGLALKALYGTGVDAGTVRTTFEFLERQRRDDRTETRENREAIRALERELAAVKKSVP